MCDGGGSSAANKLAQDAADEEKRRQWRIDTGMNRLDEIFGGDVTRGTQAFDPTTMTFDRAKTYYDAAGQPIAWKTADPTRVMSAYPDIPVSSGGGKDPFNGWDPMGGFGSLPSTLAGAPATSELYDRLLNGGLYQGTETTGFGPTFYQKAYDATKAYQLPQVEQQFQDAQRNLAYGLARQGISQSSAGYNLGANLAKEHALALQDVETNANKAKSDLQQSVQDEKAGLVQLLQSTGNMQSVLNDANTRSRQLAEASTPLQTMGPLFQNATATLADMIVSPALRQQGGGATGGYGTGSSKGSGKVIGT